MIRISQYSVSASLKQKSNLDKILQLEDIAILSIGIGETGEPYIYDQVKTWKTLEWAKHITNIFMEPNSQIDSTICRQIMDSYESQLYLLLQFDLNERFKVKPGEADKDLVFILRPEERINRFTTTQVSEE